MARGCLRNAMNLLVWLDIVSDSTTNTGSHIEWKGVEPYEMKRNHLHIHLQVLL